MQSMSLAESSVRRLPERARGCPFRDVVLLMDHSMFTPCARDRLPLVIMSHVLLEDRL